MEVKQQMIHSHLSKCHSTQEVLKEQLKERGRLQNPFLVSCDEQTAGYGRNQKAWIPMEHGLCFSFTLTPHQVPTMTAMEVSLLCLLYFEVFWKKEHLSLKWPNDLWTEDKKKWGGVLIQSFQDVLICGVGLNLFSSHGDFGGVFAAEELKDIESKSTESKSTESKKVVSQSIESRDKKVWAREITEFILSHRFEESVTLKKSWLEKCGHMNQEVMVREQKVRGIFCGLGEYGEALIEQQDSHDKKDLKERSSIVKVFNGSLEFPQNFN